MLFFTILMFICTTKAYVLEEECLNYTIYPAQYELTIIPHIFKDGTSYYDCDLLITVIANAPNVNIIELDAKELEIKSGSIKVLDGVTDIVNQHRPYEFDNKRGKLFIYLREPMKQYSASRTQYIIRVSFVKYVHLDSEGVSIVPYKGDDGKQAVNPNIRRHVFCQGLLSGNYSDWQFMYQRRLNSNNQADETAMLRALGCTSDSQAVQEFLQMVLSSNVKAQDSVNALSFLYMGNRANARTALEFLKPRVEEFRKKVVLPAWFNNVLSNLASYLDEAGLNDMETWLRANQATIPGASTGLNAIASARSSMDWGTQKASSILRAARGSAIIVAPTSILFLLTALLLLK